MIYVLDAGDFRKIGKTANFLIRRESLMREYKIDSFKKEWVSHDFDSFDSAECIAHSVVHKSNISGEKFSESFEECVKACMSAVLRSEGQMVVGEICGLDILVDPYSGFINATKFVANWDRKIAIYQFLKNDSVADINANIVEQTNQPAYFSTRGKNSATFVHPLIFIELNRHLTARHKMDVYLWMLNDMRYVEPISNCLRKVLPTFNFKD